jgi:hypothetical protein
VAGLGLTLFAELATREIQIPDNNNHVENLMGIVGQRVKKNRQSRYWWTFLIFTTVTGLFG